MFVVYAHVCVHMHTSIMQNCVIYYTHNSCVQVTTRQLSESRDSLQFSIKSCEQLELKIDELEKVNCRLERLCENRQTLIDQKSAALQELEEEYRQLKLKYDQMQQKSEQNKDSDNDDKDANEPPVKLNCHLHKPLMLERTQEILELKAVVEELTLKVQKLSYQRQKAERQLEEVMSENEELTVNAEQTESEIAELQAKLKIYEEVFELQNCDSAALSPKIQAPPLASTPYRGDIQSPINKTPIQKSHKSSTSEIQFGMSLFSELDEEYSTLRQNYCQLVQECTCSASLPHKHKYTRSQVSTGVSPDTVQPTLHDLNKPLKDLFDEVFHTLEQTAQVADRLIERKSTNQTSS